MDCVKVMHACVRRFIYYGQLASKGGECRNRWMERCTRTGLHTGSVCTVHCEGYERVHVDSELCAWCVSLLFVKADVIRSSCRCIVSSRKWLSREELEHYRCVSNWQQKFIKELVDATERMAPRRDSQVIGAEEMGSNWYWQRHSAYQLRACITVT